MTTQASGNVDPGRRHLRRSAGHWALAGFICLILAIAVALIAPPSGVIDGLLGVVFFLALVGLAVCLLVMVVQAIRATLYHRDPLDVVLGPIRQPDQLAAAFGGRQPQRYAAGPVVRREVTPMVLHPSWFASRSKWIRNLRLSAVGILIIVTVYRLWTAPSTGSVLLAVLAALVITALLFFGRAEIAVDASALTYRRFVIARRFPLQRVGGLAIRPLYLAFNYYAVRPPPYAVVYGADRRALFSFSPALWDESDLRRLQKTLGGDTSLWSVNARELNEEFPGALPGWVVLTDSHPIWTVVVGTPLMFIAICLGIVISDLATTGKP